MKSYKNILFIIIVAVFFVSFASAEEWTGPSAAPPNSNAPAPINVSDSDQTKEGSITVDKYLGTSPATTPSVPVNGMIYYDSTDKVFRCRENEKWWNCVGGFFELTTDSIVKLITKTRITNVSAPINQDDVATKGYVDLAGGGSGGSGVPLTGVKGGTVNLWREKFTKLGIASFSMGDCEEKMIGSLPSDQNSYELIFCAQNGYESDCSVAIMYSLYEKGDVGVHSFPGNPTLTSLTSQSDTGTISDIVLSSSDPNAVAFRMRFEVMNILAPYTFLFNPTAYPLRIVSPTVNYFGAILKDGNLIIRRSPVSSAVSCGVYGYTNICQDTEYYFPPSSKCLLTTPAVSVAVWYR